MGISLKNIISKVTVNLKNLEWNYPPPNSAFENVLKKSAPSSQSLFCHSIFPTERQIYSQFKPLLFSIERFLTL